MESPITCPGVMAAIGMAVRIHDPFVADYAGDLYGIAEGCDALILMVNHSAYQELNLPLLDRMMRTPILVDTRRVLDPNAVKAAGLKYYLLDVGN